MAYFDWDEFADPAEAAGGQETSEKSGGYSHDSAEVAVAQESSEKTADSMENLERADDHPGWYSLKPVVKDRKIRLACLHGTASNGKILMMQLAPLFRIKGFRDAVEFVFIDGAIDATADPKNHQIASQQKAFPGQTLYQYVNYDWESQFGMADYKNIDEAVAHVELQMQANAPIDGIVGFSQGGILGLLLAARAASGDGPPLALMLHLASSFPAWTYRYKDLFAAKLAIPSMHVWGEIDNVGYRGPPDGELMSYYSNPVFLSHSGDHRPFPPQRAEADELASKVFSFIKESAA